MNPIVCCRMVATWDCSCKILELASASFAWSSAFSADRASRACGGGRVVGGGGGGGGGGGACVRECVCVVSWCASSIGVCVIKDGVDVCNTRIYICSSRDQYTDVQKSVISRILFPWTAANLILSLTASALCSLSFSDMSSSQ